jgi:hypothetical protein
MKLSDQVQELLHLRAVIRPISLPPRLIIEESAERIGFDVARPIRKVSHALSLPLVLHWVGAGGMAFLCIDCNENCCDTAMAGQGGHAELRS